MSPVVAFLCLVQFVDVLGVTELITAMPRILGSLGASDSAATPLLTGYAMCFGGLLMLGARLGDRIGQRRALLLGLGAFAAGSLLAALAPSIVPLVVGRCIQGASAALSVPAALRLMITATPEPESRRRALAAWSASGAAAGALGYVLGGAFTEFVGWRAMFWANLPIALVIGAGLVRRPIAAAGRRVDGIDLPGALLFTAAMMSVVLAASLLEPPVALAAGLLSAMTAGGLLAALVWVERRAADPLLPIALLRQRRVRVGARTAFLNTATTSPVIAIATLELQRTARLSPAAAGARLVPFSICVIAGAGIAVPALRRLDSRRVIALGLGVIALGDASLLGLGGSQWLLAIAVGVSGAGIGLSSVAATGLGTRVPEPQQATAAGALNTAAQLGTALGVAALLALVATTAHAALPIHGARLGWGAAALVAVAGAAATVRERAGGSSRGERIRGARSRSPDTPAQGRVWH